jgi:hypothetical protein
VRGKFIGGEYYELAAAILRSLNFLHPPPLRPIRPIRPPNSGDEHTQLVLPNQPIPNPFGPRIVIPGNLSDSRYVVAVWMCGRHGVLLSAQSGDGSE